MGRYKTRELAHVGVDYIRAIIKADNANDIKLLSKNSNSIGIDFNGFELVCIFLPIASKKWERFYQILYKNTSIGFIGLDGIKTGSIVPSNMIEITGQGLNIFGTDIFYFLMGYFKFDFVKYKRLDFAMDLFLNIQYFWEKILVDKFKKEKTYCPIVKQGIVETIYFGERDQKKNNYQIVRIYDKIKDTVKKDKLYLYHEERKKEKGEGYKDVTRFEVEIREDLAKTYDYYSINNTNIIFAKMVKTFFQYNKQYFKFIDFEDFHNYFEDLEKEKIERKKILKKIKNGDTEIKPKTKYQEKIINKIKSQENFARFGTYFLNDKDKEMTKKNFLAYARKLYINGFTIEQLTEILDSNLKDEFIEK